MANNLVEVVANGGWDERIIVCRHGALVDTTIIVTERWVVLVDTLVNLATAQALIEIATPFLDRRALLVVNTHADWDHAWGNHAFVGPQALHPAPIIARQLCAERLRTSEAEMLATMRERQTGRFDDVVLTPPTLLFDQTLRIDGGDLTLELFATPGHQPDHLSIYIPEIRTLLAGDAAELPFPFPRSAADLPILRQSLDRMAAYELAVALYCHAPGVASPSVISHNRTYFDRLEQACRQALANGVPAKPAEDADLEVLIQFSYQQAVADIGAGLDAEELAGFYRPGHLASIRKMLEWVASSA
jgi:glyoxylase-like metal-dependent hydrolase (beta-lactamase superfamily II)